MPKASDLIRRIFSCRSLFCSSSVLAAASLSLKLRGRGASIEDCDELARYLDPDGLSCPSRFRRPGGRLSDMSFAFRPLSIPRRTRLGEVWASGAFALRTGEAGITVGCEDGAWFMTLAGRGLSRSSWVVGAGKARCGPAAAPSPALVDCVLDLSFCSFFSLRRACISCSLSCKVSSSSSSSPPPAPFSIISVRDPSVPFKALLSLSGDGDGDVRSASRRILSRPPGVPRRTSWGERGGH